MLQRNGHRLAHLIQSFLDLAGGAVLHPPLLRPLRGKLHPQGRNFVVVARTTSAIEKRFVDLSVWLVSLPELIKRLMIPSR